LRRKVQSGNFYFKKRHYYCHRRRRICTAISVRDANDRAKFP